MKKRFTLTLCLSILMMALLANAQNWQWQNPLPTGNHLGDIVFVNEDTGWIVGSSGTILHTTDGGATWTFQGSGTNSQLTAVCFLDNQRGFAAGGESG